MPCEGAACPGDNLISIENHPWLDPSPESPRLLPPYWQPFALSSPPRLSFCFFPSSKKETVINTSVACTPVGHVQCFFELREFFVKTLVVSASKHLATSAEVAQCAAQIALHKPNSC